jgi:type I restriction enzyme S subunit
LGEISKFIEYGTSEKASDIQDDVPVFRMNNIQNGKLTFNKLKYVSASIRDLPKLYLQDGDLLFNRTNSYELVGKTGLFRGENNQYTFASYLIRITLFLEYINPEFINLVINSPYFRQSQIEPEIVQQCGQANFNGTKLQNTLIPLPPLAEQKRIVAKVDELMQLCDQLEESLRQSHQRAESLAASAISHLTI